MTPELLMTALGATLEGVTVYRGTLQGEPALPALVWRVAGRETPPGGFATVQVEILVLADTADGAQALSDDALATAAAHGANSLDGPVDLIDPGETWWTQRVEIGLAG